MSGRGKGPDGPRGGIPGRGPGVPPPLDFTYRCHGCRARFDLIHGHPKAGLCALCGPALASPHTILAIAERCSENPPAPADADLGV